MEQITEENSVLDMFSFENNDAKHGVFLYL